MVDIKKSLGSTRIIMCHLPSCWPVMSEDLSRFPPSLSPRHGGWRVTARHGPSSAILPADGVVWLPQAETMRALVEGQ